MSDFPKAYLRMSPNLDQHPNPLAMVQAMCAANRQPERGRFREPIVLERTLGKKAYRQMVERGDIVPAVPGPGVYLDGWDEWQEGDMTVAERMRRHRARKAAKKAKRNAAVTPDVTPPASPDRNAVTTTASSSSLTSTTSGSEDVDEPLPRRAGRRKEGTNPRAVGTNPRAQGTSIRQEREAQKRGPINIGAILRAAAEGKSA